MLEYERPVEGARRCVAEAQRRMDEQIDRIRRLGAEGHEELAAAEARLLVVLAENLKVMQEYLAMEESAADQRARGHESSPDHREAA